MFLLDLVLSIILVLTAVIGFACITFILKSGSVDAYDSLIRIFHKANVEIYVNFELSGMKIAAILTALICLGYFMPLTATALFAIHLTCILGTRYACRELLPAMLRRRNLIVG